MLGLLLVALSAAAASCSAEEAAPSTEIEGLGSSLTEIERLARREGELHLVVAPEYAQSAWADLFAQQTGCAVNFATAESSSDMVGLLEADRWDGVSAPGDVSVRLMRARDAAPIDPALIPNFDSVVEGLENRSFNSLDGQPYGAPIGRVASLLLFRSDLIAGVVDSWRALWAAPGSYAGHVSIENDAFAIAEAALYLKAARPLLRIDDPYELDQPQFRATVALLRREAPKVGHYWTRDVEEQVLSYASDESVIGTGLPRAVERLEDEGASVEAVKPVEGTTGRSDTWMVSSSASTPNCAYLWMDFMLSPEAQVNVVERFDVAPANLTACELTEDAGLCALLHADDEAWWADVHFRKLPLAHCGDGRGESCVPHEEWSAAWKTITAKR
jgi:putative spermidine/putrescine transport system substrate-binding protein